MPRTKRKPETFGDLIEAGFVEMVGYRHKGRVKKMPRLELMVLQKIRGAAQGDPGCIKFLLKYLKKPDPKITKSNITFEYVYPDGQREIPFQDGHREIAHTDGRIESLWPDGSRQINYPDGRIEAVDENGDTTWTSQEEMEALGWPTTLEELKRARES
jgi:hypothetical protein